MSDPDALAETILRQNTLSPSDWNTFDDIVLRHGQESRSIPTKYRTAWEYARAVHADRQLLIDLINRIYRP